MRSNRSLPPTRAFAEEGGERKGKTESAQDQEVVMESSNVGRTRLG